MDQFREVLDLLNEPRCAERIAEKYKSGFRRMVEEVSPEQVHKVIEEHSDSLIILAPVFAGALVHCKRFQEAFEFVRGIDMSGSDHTHDYLNGLLIKCFYTAVKQLGGTIDLFYKLLVSNKRFGNEYSVAVLDNCILDFQISRGIYLVPETGCSCAGGNAQRKTVESCLLCVEHPVENEEAAAYALHIGFIFLVRGEYSLALSAFMRADVVGNCGERLGKCLIVTKLLLGDYMIYLPCRDELRPYFALIGAVRRAELDGFQRILNNYREEFIAEGLYFVIRRLLRNILQEGLRKISICYSRIPVADISKILGVEQGIGFLLHSAIHSGFVKGYARDGIFYGAPSSQTNVLLGERIRETINVRKTISGLMRYPEIPSLTLELVVEGE